MIKDDGRLFYNVNELTKLIPLSRNSIYKACETGEIRCVRIGKRVLVSKREVLRLAGEWEAHNG